MYPLHLHRLALPAFIVSASVPEVCCQSAERAHPSEANTSPVALERLVVTGTNIPTSVDALSVPLTALERADISATGIDANVLELLRKRLPVFSGSSNLGNSNANVSTTSTSGGSSVALRNLDTLVLLNGRRVATSGANARGGNSFVDVNQIPVAAIERIEVVTDGASAIYGSDAVGGVLNIVLRSEFQGIEAGGRFALASGDGNYTERSFHFIAGLGARGIQVTAAATSSKTDRLLQSDRPFSRTITGRNATVAGAVGEGTAFPRYFLNPALNSPRERNPVGAAATARSLAELVANGTYVDLGSSAFATIAGTFDQAPYATLLLGQEQRTGMVSASAELVGRKLVAFGDYFRSETVGTSQLPAQGTTPTLTIPAGAPFNPVSAPIAQVAFRYLPYTRPFTNTGRLDRVVTGFRGALGREWTWESACNFNQNRTTLRVRNVFYGPNVDRAVAGGFDAQGVRTAGGTYSRVRAGYSESSGTFVIQPALDPFARAPAVDPASLQNVLGEYVGDARSRLTSWDFKLAGRAITLPAGKLHLAAGVDFRRESLVATPDENARLTGPTAARWLAVPLFDPFDRSRRIDAGFAEVRVPVAGRGWNLPGARALDLTAAYRVETYSDAGRSRVPKFGLRWQPVDPQLTLRATYSEAFTAPPLFSLFGPVTRVFTPAAIIPNVFGVSGQAQAESGANPSLRSSAARSRSVGLVASPHALKGLTASVNFVSVTQEELIGSVGVTTILQSVEQLGPQSPYAAQVAFVNFPGERDARSITRAGELGDFLRAGNSAYGLFIADTRTNLAGQRIKALDASLEYAVPLPTAWGALQLGSTSTFFLDYRFRALPTQPFFEYAGHATNGGTGAQGTMPGYRAYSSAAWRRGRWAVGIGHTYVPPVTDIGPGGIAFATSATLRRRPVASHATWDFSLSHRIDSKSMHAGWRRFLGESTMTVGVNNAGNRMPPLAPQAFNESNVDAATYSVLGRVAYVSGSVKY